jgi:tungstate transport system permease protein
MTEQPSIFSLALGLLTSGDAELFQIIALSLRVTLTSVLIGALIAIPLAAALTVKSFPGRGFIIALINAFMGLPPVVVGLAVYLMLSRSGPLGVLGLLYTPTAMIIAQTILVVPLITALARQSLADLHNEYDELFRSLQLSPARKISALISDGRFSLATAVLAGFGRAIAEVGAVLIVGGNIEHVTRVMTTAIALETSKGNLALALALGLILIAISLAINLAVVSMNRAAEKQTHA